MTPEDIERRDFFVGLRGYDRDEVDAFLTEVAAQHRALLDELERYRNGAEATPAPVDPISDVGASIAAILRTANEQAEQIVSQAHARAEETQQQAEQIVSQARARAEEIQQQAEEHATHLRQEAGQFAEHLRSETEHEVTRLRDEASNEAERVRAEAADEAARVRGEATQTLERAQEQAAGIVRQAEDSVDRITAEAEQRGRERALERADAEVARLNEAIRRHEELRSRLSEASDELSLALMAMGEPIADPFVAVRDVVLVEPEAPAANGQLTTPDL